VPLRTVNIPEGRLQRACAGFELETNGHSEPRATTRVLQVQIAMWIHKRIRQQQRWFQAACYGQGRRSQAQAVDVALKTQPATGSQLTSARYTTTSESLNHKMILQAVRSVALSLTHSCSTVCSRRLQASSTDSCTCFGYTQTTPARTARCTGARIVRMHLAPGPASCSAARAPACTADSAAASARPYSGRSELRHRSSPAPSTTAGPLPRVLPASPLR
jgi:hypothetical protein